MENQSIFTSLLSHLYTTSDADQIDSIISNALGSFYKLHHTNVLKDIVQSLPERLGNELDLILKQNNVPMGNDELVKSFLEHLSQALHDATILTMTVAQPLSYQMTQDLAKNVKKTFGPQVLVEFAIDPSIIAGAIISFNGYYYDESLKAKLQKYLTSTNLKKSGA